MSVAVQAPSAIKSSSIAPGPVLEVRSESICSVCPDGLTALNLCSPIHFTFAVCMVLLPFMAVATAAGKHNGGLWDCTSITTLLFWL